MSATTRRAGDFALGILLIALIVGASAAIDLTSAWALSGNQHERMILVVVAVVCVVWKVVGSVKIRGLWTSGRRGSAILPIVLHTGTRPWGTVRTLRELLVEPTVFRPFLPDWTPLYWELATQ